MAKKTKKNTRFTNGRPSKHWYNVFLRGNPELSVRVCQNLTKRRFQISEEGFRGWYAKVDAYLKSKNLNDIAPERIFNLNESGFFLSPKHGKVLVHKGEKAIYNICGSDKECYTALIAGNAAGQLCAPMVIYDYERIPASIANNFPIECRIGKSDTGWIQSETFYGYIANHLQPWCVENNIEFPILSYVDGHSSHLTVPLSDFYVEHKIELIALYPNATQLHQPMDVALFHSLKAAYREATRAWRIVNMGRRLDKVFFPSVLKAALDSLDIKSILKNGFIPCGLSPLSADAINYSKLITHAREEVLNEDTNKQIDQSTSEDTIKLIESNIDFEILNQFKSCNESDEWTGSVEYRELYKFWLKFIRQQVIKPMNQECHESGGLQVKEVCEPAVIELISEEISIAETGATDYTV